MRRTIQIRTGILLLFVSTWCVAFGQHTAEKSLLVCNQNFTLWMTRGSALGLLTDSGECIATKIKGEEKGTEFSGYILALRNDPSSVMGQLYFFKDRLATIQRSWEKDVTSEIDFGRVLIGLLHKLQEEGFVNCIISTSYRSTPELDTKTAQLRCGVKQLELDYTEYKGAKSIQITETLG